MNFSIIIVNYNGKKFILDCLKSIFDSRNSSFEIIIVDNGSTDDSIYQIKKQFKNQIKKIKIISLRKNFGPAYARNIGVKSSSGKYICFLDNDTQVDSNWLKPALKEFTKNPKTGCIQSKLLLLDHKNRFDYAGDYLNQFGFLSHRATYRDLDRGQFNQRQIIFAAKSAGMFIRKDVFQKIGGFDKDFFIYMEETDLCWRSWLQNYQTVYLPDSIVYHGFSGSFKILNRPTANYNLRFHGTKNYILALIKNLSSRQLFFILPKQIFIFIAFSLYLLFFKLKIKESVFVLGGIMWNLKNLSKTLSKRKKIQSFRKNNDQQLFKFIFYRDNFFNKLKKVYIK